MNFVTNASDCGWLSGTATAVIVFLKADPDRHAQLAGGRDLVEKIFGASRRHHDSSYKKTSRDREDPI
jgi:hypothetical protein